MTTKLSGAPLSTKDSARSIATSTQGSSLADVLERVLDKGIVIAGDISISVADTELINIRIRLLISSVDKAREIGINWWEDNPHFNSQASSLIEANHKLMERVENLESELKTLRSLPAAPAATPAAPSWSLDSLAQDL
ncbi:MAG: gas vesicle protein [Leptolyngbya sp.]|nr:MAG: gas vesicle protein [Leptolyngbya sp.]